jgi:tetratricopeptide (TPR) repeat protein
MTAHSHFRRLTPKCEPSSRAHACVVTGLVVLVVLSAGCRVFRSHKVSEENIAAARQLSLQGIDAQQRNQWERAESLFATAILKCPTDERARSGYAESLWQRGHWQESIAQMEESVRLSGGDPSRRVRLGQMYRSLGDQARARAQAEQALAANPQLAAAWALRAQVLMAQGDRGEALANYHRALSYDSSLPGVQLAIAEIYAQENRPQRALATLQALAQTTPSGPAAAEMALRQARALVALNRQSDAIALLTKTGERADAPAGLLHELALIQLAAGDAAAARRAIELGINRYPEDSRFRTLAQDLARTAGGVAPASATGEVMR